MLPILVAAAVILVVGALYGPHSVTVFVELPEGSQSVSSLQMRVTRLDGNEVLRAYRERHPTGARSFVVHTRLPRGTFEMEAWPDGKPPPLWAKFAFNGRSESVDVLLGPQEPK